MESTHHRVLPSVWPKPGGTQTHTHRQHRHTDTQSCHKHEGCQGWEGGGQAGPCESQLPRPQRRQANTATTSSVSITPALHARIVHRHVTGTADTPDTGAVHQHKHHNAPVGVERELAPHHGLLTQPCTDDTRNATLRVRASGVVATRAWHHLEWPKHADQVRRRVIVLGLCAAIGQACFTRAGIQTHKRGLTHKHTHATSTHNKHARAHPCKQSTTHPLCDTVWHQVEVWREGAA